MRTFGEFLRERRLRLGYTLRAFCRRHGEDPGYISKLENGRLRPPASEDTLRRLAETLELDEGSDGWWEFMDLAAMGRGAIPADLLEQDKLRRAISALLAMMRGRRAEERELDELIALIPLRLRQAAGRIQWERVPW